MKGNKYKVDYKKMKKSTRPTICLKEQGLFFVLGQEGDGRRVEVVMTERPLDCCLKENLLRLFVCLFVC